MLQFERTQQPSQLPTTQYPWLGYHRTTGLVVLFTEPHVGTILDPGTTTSKLCAQGKTYDETQYVPYIGPFTLTNVT